MPASVQGREGHGAPGEHVEQVGATAAAMAPLRQEGAEPGQGRSGRREPMHAAHAWELARPHEGSGTRPQARGGPAVAREWQHPGGREDDWRLADLLALIGEPAHARGRDRVVVGNAKGSSYEESRHCYRHKDHAGEPKHRPPAVLRAKSTPPFTARHEPEAGGAQRATVTYDGYDGYDSMWTRVSTASSSASGLAAAAAMPAAAPDAAGSAPQLSHHGGDAAGDAGGRQAGGAWRVGSHSRSSPARPRVRCVAGRHKSRVLGALRARINYFSDDVRVCACVHVCLYVRMHFMYVYIDLYIRVAPAYAPTYSPPPPHTTAHGRGGRACDIRGRLCRRTAAAGQRARDPLAPCVRAHHSRQRACARGASACRSDVAAHHTRTRAHTRTRSQTDHVAGRQARPCLGAASARKVCQPWSRGGRGGGRAGGGGRGGGGEGG